MEWASILRCWEAGINREEIIAKNLADPVYFCERFLEDWFPDPMPWVHRGLLAIMTRRCAFLPQYGDMDKIIRHFVWSPDWENKDSPRYPIFFYEDGQLKMRVGKMTAVMMPRGFSKTTLCNGKNVYKVLHHLTKFLLYVSESSPHAVTQLNNVKMALEHNELIQKVYGAQKGPKWTEDYIETSTGIYGAARGRGGQIRGLLIGPNRPDDITIDDVEDEESVLTDIQRDKAKTWLYQAVMPALSKRYKGAGLTMLGTLLHADSALMTVSKDPRFNFIRFSAIDMDGEPLWPGHMTLESLEIEKQAWGEAGRLGAWYREYMSQLHSADTAKFKDTFIYNSEIKDLICLALAVDPAISIKPGADFFAISVCGMTAKGKARVLEAEGAKGVHPRQQIDMVFQLYQSWKARLPNLAFKVGVEATAYQMALVHLLREEMFRKHCYFEIQELKYNQKKVERVEGILQARYANGYVEHARRFPLLETQLLDWPNGKLDFPDVLSMAISLLDPFASAAADGRDLEANEFEELDMVESAP